MYLLLIPVVSNEQYIGVFLEYNGLLLFFFRGSFHLPNLRAVNPNVGMYSGGETPTKTGTSPPSPYSIVSPKGSVESNTSLRNELKDLDSPTIINKEKKDSINKSVGVGVGVTKATETAEKGQITDMVEQKERSTDTSKCTQRKLTCR